MSLNVHYSTWFVSRDLPAARHKPHVASSCDAEPSCANVKDDVAGFCTGCAADARGPERERARSACRVDFVRHPTLWTGQRIHGAAQSPQPWRRPLPMGLSGLLGRRGDCHILVAAAQPLCLDGLRHNTVCHGADGDLGFWPASAHFQQPLTVSVATLAREWVASRHIQLQAPARGNATQGLAALATTTLSLPASTIATCRVFARIGKIEKKLPFGITGNRHL